MMKKESKINWLNTIFLTVVPVVGVGGTIALIATGHFHWQTLVFMLIFMGVTGLSITAGYHRLFSHKSYRTNWLIKLGFLLFGAAAFEGSAFEWCSDHRDHHLYTDTEKDPYNIKQGFWYAHIGWLLTLDTSRRCFDNIPDLKEDKLVAFQHKFFVYLGITVGFILPMLIAMCWGDWLGGLIMAGALRITFVHHFTFCINSVTHTIGKKTYSDRNSARDHWLSALVTFGEGYHNFHHKFPIDYRNGVKFYHFDPTKWLIRSLAFVSMAKDLKQISEEHILRYKNLMRDQKASSTAK